MAKEYAKSFYKSRPWRCLREYIYVSRHGICELCGMPGDEVHHIIPITPSNINDINITLNEKNLILLCRKCHRKQHKEKERYTFNENGDVIPPHSGKKHQNT